MRLKKQPRRPKYIPYISLQNYMRARNREDWMLYLPVFKDLPQMA